MKRMDIKLSQCFIAVDDHDKALAFYRDVGATAFIAEAERLLPTAV